MREIVTKLGAEYQWLRVRAVTLLGESAWLLSASWTELQALIWASE